MRAIAIVPGRPDTAGMIDLPEPPASDGSVLVRTRLIGICGANGRGSTSARPSALPGLRSGRVGHVPERRLRRAWDQGALRLRERALSHRNYVLPSSGP